MKYSLLVATAFGLALFSCNNKPASNPQTEQTVTTDTVVAQQAEVAVKQDTLQAMGLEYLYTQLKAKAGSAGITTLGTNGIQFGNSIITLDVETEFDGQQKGAWIYAAAFNVTCGNLPAEALRTGSIGIGKTQGEARQVCVQEWMASFARPFAHMLNDTLGVVQDDLKIYPGFAGVRGEATEWLKARKNLSEKIVERISPILKKVPGEVLLVDVKVAMSTEGVRGAECRINNQVAPELWKALQSLNWGKAKSEFMFKQFYLVKRVKA